MAKKTPTIKGIFLNSHVTAVRQKAGEEGVKKLQDRFGLPVQFKNSDDIPIRDEVRLIECALDVLSETPVDPKIREFEAGRLHFRNFTQTPLAKIIFSVFRSNFKFMMLHAPDIAGHVFEGVVFTTMDTGETSVTVTMENVDYPIEHFRGLFYEWMVFAGLKGEVEALELPDKYVYRMHWG